MESGQATVSVVIPAFNAHDWIRQTLESVLVQTYPDLVVHVVDDGSSDDTRQIVSAVQDPRVRLHSSANAGTSGARNRGLAEVQTPFVAFLDHDDIWFPRKLEVAMPLFGDTEVVAVGSAMRYANARGRLFGYVGQSPDGSAQEAIRAGELMPFPLSGTIFRSEAARAAGGFDSAYDTAEDFDFFIRVAQLGRFAWTPEPLGAHRLHGGSATDARHDRQFALGVYLREREAARAGGRSVQPVEEFLSNFHPTRKERRRAAAMLQFRVGVVALASGSPLRGIRSLLSAFTHDPAYLIASAMRRSGPRGRTRRARV